MGTNKTGRKSRLPTGGNPVLPQGEGPSRGNSRDFFHRIFGIVPDFQETKHL